MKKWLVIILVFCLFPSVFGQKQLSLEEAISIALQKNSSLIKTKNSLRATEKQVLSAWGDLFPNLGVNGRWSWTKITDKGGSQVDFLGNIQEIDPSEIDTRDYSLSAGGNVVLFDGLANYANISQKEDNLDAAKYDLERFKQDIVLLTTDYFYNVIKAAAIQKVREENVKYNQKFLEQIQERNRLGSIPIADVYQQQVQLGNAELALIQAENDYQVALNTFLDYLALNVLEEYELISPFMDDLDKNLDRYLEDFDEVEVMIETAFNNRYDFKSQQLTLSSAQSGVTIANGGFWPSLSANYSFSSRATELSTLLDFSRKVWGVGLSLNIPIFSNFNTLTSSEFAKVQELNAREDLLVLERQIKIEIKQGYINLLASKKGVDVSSKNVQSSQENRRVLYERYNLGSGTILDVLQADRDFIDAQTNKITTLYAFYISRDRLLNYLGRLDYSQYE